MAILFCAGLAVLASHEQVRQIKLPRLFVFTMNAISGMLGAVVGFMLTVM